MRPLLLFLVLGAATSSVLPACSSPSEPHVEITNLSLRQTGDEYPTVSGVVHNRSERVLSSADVTIGLYNENNMPIQNGAVRVQVRNIAPGDSARFSRALDVRPRGAQVKEVIVN